MLWIVIAAAVGFFVGAGLTIAGIVTFYALLNALNATLPADARFDPLGWGPDKYGRFWTAVSRAEPRERLDTLAGRYRLFQYSGVALMLVSLLTTLWAFRADH